MIYRFAVATVLLSCAAANGYCKSYPDPPIREFSEYNLTSEGNDLRIAIYPITDKRESKKYFGKHLVKSGLLPIQIIYFNDSPDRIYTVLKEEISYSVGDEIGLVEQPNDKFKGTAGKTLGIASAIAISPIGLLTGGALSARANSLRHNLSKKELRDQSLAPGGSTSGFIFVPIDKKRSGLPIKIWIKGFSDDNGEPVHDFSI